MAACAAAKEAELHGDLTSERGLGSDFGALFFALLFLTQVNKWSGEKSSVQL
jgi:hypothetical protein